MKRFKDLLNEFRENIPPIDRQRPQGDPFEEIEKFMKTVSFTHTTAKGNTLHFNNSHEAAKMIADDKSTHALGMHYAHSIGDDMMVRYFGNSTSSHDDLMDSVRDFIVNHEKLPNHLKPHVDKFLMSLESKAHSMANTQNQMIQTATGTRNGLGERIYKFSKPWNNAMQGRTDHPQINNPEVHLHKLIQTVSKDPDMGYWLRKEEM